VLRAIEKIPAHHFLQSAADRIDLRSPSRIRATNNPIERINTLGFHLRSRELIYQTYETKTLGKKKEIKEINKIIGEKRSPEFGEVTSAAVALPWPASCPLRRTPVELIKILGRFGGEVTRPVPYSRHPLL